MIKINPLGMNIKLKYFVSDLRNAKFCYTYFTDLEA